MQLVFESKYEYSQEYLIQWMDAVKLTVCNAFQHF